jgi:hypothetical protein
MNTVVYILKQLQDQCFFKDLQEIFFLQHFKIGTKHISYCESMFHAKNKRL